MGARQVVGRAGATAAVLAVVLLWSFAAVNLYWALGGRAGIGTLGGRVEEWAADGNRFLLVANVAAVAVKVAIGALALGLLTTSSRSRARILCWTCIAVGTVMACYGLVQEAAVVSVLLGVIDVSDPPSRSVLLWRSLLWEPWFLLSGVLVLAAAVSRRRTLGPERKSP